METYCRDETDPIQQAKGPDFITESVIYVIDFDLYPIRAHGHGSPGVRRAVGRPQAAGGGRLSLQIDDLIVFFKQTICYYVNGHHEQYMSKQASYVTTFFILDARRMSL